MGRKQFNIIYKATNTIENKYYIGQTITTLPARRSLHKTKALKRNAPSPFYEAIRKYGWEAFSWEVVCYCKDQEELDLKEKETIESLGRGNCYNAFSGGKIHYKMPEKNKKDISERMKGERNHQYGKKRTPEEMKKCKEASLEVCSKRVMKIETGEIYSSVSECAKKNNCSIGLVSLHCNNKIRTQKYRFL